MVMVLGNHPKGPGFKSRSDYQSRTMFWTLLCFSSPICSKFPALALQTDLVQLCQYLLFTRHVKISFYSSVKVYIKCKGGRFRRWIGSPKLLTVVHWSLIAPYHKEHRLRMLLGVVRDISQEETCG